MRFVFQDVKVLIFHSYNLLQWPRRCTFHSYILYSNPNHWLFQWCHIAPAISGTQNTETVIMSLPNSVEKGTCGSWVPSSVNCTQKHTV